MPFGLCNGPATYSRLIQLALSGIPMSMAIPYLDDIIVLSKNIQSHFQHLEKILQIHRSAGLKLQPSKCFLFQEEVEYLGHLVSKNGVKTIPEYVKIVQDWEFPQTKSDVRIFLGKVGYYRRFIKNYSGIAGPLTDLSGKGTPEEEKAIIKPTPSTLKAFHTLKQELLKAPILAYPQFHSKEPFILDTDWCQETNAIGGVLSQVQDGKERVIQYGGKKMSSSQKNYDPFKGELAAVLHFAKIWKYYLQYRKFILRTDHAPLTFMTKMQPQDRHTLRMLSVLADLDFEIKHRRGASHGNADGISRAPHLRKQPDAQEDVGTDDDDLMLLSFINNIEEELEENNNDEEHERNETQAPHSSLYDREAMLILQEDDEDLQPVRESLIKGTKPSMLQQAAMTGESRSYFGMWEQLMIGEDGLVRVRRLGPPSSNKKALLCLPRETWDPIIRKIHQEGGHCGLEATMERISRSFYFPHMKSETQDILRRCQICQQKGGPNVPQKHTLISQQEGQPFQRLSIDFVGPIPGRKPNYIFTARDTFTKWLEAFPVTAPTAEHAVKKLVDEVFRRFGIPETIHSDRGTHFTAHKFNEVMKMLNTTHTITPAYNPKSNPVERAHRDLGNMLRALSLETKQHWTNCLPAALMAINTNRHAGTMYSPFKLLFGHDPPFPLDLAYRLPDEDERLVLNTDISDYVQQLRQRLQTAYTFVRENMGAAIERRRQAYTRTAITYQEGDKVWLYTYKSLAGMPKKFTTRWTGPWTIIRKISPVLFEIKADPAITNERQKIQMVGVDRIKKYYGDMTIPVTSDHDPEAPGDLFGERPNASPLPPKSPKTPKRPPPSSRPDSDDDSDSDGGGGGAISQAPRGHRTTTQQSPPVPPTRMAPPIASGTFPTSFQPSPSTAFRSTPPQRFRTPFQMPRSPTHTRITHPSSITPRAPGPAPVPDPSIRRRLFQTPQSHSRSPSQLTMQERHEEDIVKAAQRLQTPNLPELSWDYGQRAWVCNSSMCWRPGHSERCSEPLWWCGSEGS